MTDLSQFGETAEDFGCRLKEQLGAVPTFAVPGLESAYRAAAEAEAVTAAALEDGRIRAYAEERREIHAKLDRIQRWTTVLMWILIADIVIVFAVNAAYVLYLLGVIA